MFTPKQDVAWWGQRYKWMKAWRNIKAMRTIHTGQIQASNYSQLLTASFTVLFNYKLSKSGKAL